MVSRTARTLSESPVLTTIGQNDRSHQQSLSINSISSIVEPVTPPDLNDHQNHHQSQYYHFSSAPSTALQAAPSYKQQLPQSASTMAALPTPLSTLNTNIGGNTMRSRFKSLPLVNELDHKFNQFNINSLQNLSQSQSQSQSFYSPSPSASSNSTNSIPQISLQQYQHQNASTGNLKQNSSQQSLPIPQQRFSSMPSIQFSSAPNSSASSKENVSASNNFKNYDELNLVPIEQLDILKLSTDQYGCRYLQKKLEVDNSIKDVIFNKVFNHLIDLIVDPFGNYLVQKLVDYLTNYQKDLMIEKIHTCLFLIAINQYGTRSLQKIIDKISNTYQMDLVVKGLQMNDTTNALEDNNIVKLIKDLNGNHVIQKCIFKFPPEKFQFIIDAICLNNNIVRISTHKHGCCVLQKLLNNASFDQILKISQVLLIYLDDLINDQFGNYIIQFLFELNFLKTSDNINFLIDEFFQKIYKNLVQLSCLKFSSNVIEKFIKILKFKKNYVYLNEIIRLINVNFESLIKDKFGNYVIQTLIDQFYDVSELNYEMNTLINTVKNYLPVIKAAPYARKIQLKIQQLETNYSLSSAINTPASFSSTSSFNGYNQTGFDSTNQLQQHQQPQQQLPNNLMHGYNNLQNVNYKTNFNPYFPTDQSYHNPNLGYNMTQGSVPNNNYHDINNTFVNSTFN